MRPGIMAAFLLLHHPRRQKENPAGKSDRVLFLTVFCWKTQDVRPVCPHFTRGDASPPSGIIRRNGSWNWASARSNAFWRSIPGCALSRPRHFNPCSCEEPHCQSRYADLPPGGLENPDGRSQLAGPNPGQHFRILKLTVHHPSSAEDLRPQRRAASRPSILSPSSRFAVSDSAKLSAAVLMPWRSHLCFS